MPFTIVRNDITTMAVDAIVNAANTDLAEGGGVCGAIFRAAGASELRAACDKLAPIATGEAVITPAFALPARHIIHAAGPVYSRYEPHESERLLRSAYTNSLKRGVENDCETVAFSLLSSGIYGYPKDAALRVASATIQDFLAEHDLDVSLVVFDKEALAVSRELLGEVESFIDEHYVAEHEGMFRRHSLLHIGRAALADEKLAAQPLSAAEPKKKKSQPMPRVAKELSVSYTAESAEPSLDDIVGSLDEPFAATLLRLIDASGRTDAQVYKRANIDRRLFSKIRSNAGYAPSKPTVLAFAVALELTLEQTRDLLSRAGFALSRSQKFDVIIEYFIAAARYDVFEINEVLFSYDQSLLGGA